VSDPLITVPDSVWKPTVKRAQVLAQLAKTQRCSKKQINEAAKKLKIGRLLVCLKAEHIAELAKRSWHWPPVAHNAFRRALICRATNASFTRRDEGHFFYRYRKNHADARQSPLI